MNHITLAHIERQYKNNGQHAEQVFRFTLTGELAKADNKPSTECGDCGDIQIKSARATVCKGTDLAAHLAEDAAKRYAYITADFSDAYIMEKDEYAAFVTAFGTVTKESSKNGGGEKIRLGHETKALLAWLAR